MHDDWPYSKRGLLGRSRWCTGSRYLASPPASQLLPVVAGDDSASYLSASGGAAGGLAQAASGGNHLTNTPSSCLRGGGLRSEHTRPMRRRETASPTRPWTVHRLRSWRQKRAQPSHWVSRSHTDLGDDNETLPWTTQRLPQESFSHSPAGGASAFDSLPASATVSFHNLKSQNFKLSVSNPKNKYVACLSVLSQISNCQGLGHKNKFEILKTDRNTTMCRPSGSGQLGVSRVRKLQRRTRPRSPERGRLSRSPGGLVVLSAQRDPAI